MNRLTAQSTWQNALLGLQDARSQRGIMSRGKNVYNGTAPEASTGPNASLRNAAARRIGKKQPQSSQQPQQPDYKQELMFRKAMTPAYAPQALPGGPTYPSSSKRLGGIR